MSFYKYPDSHPYSPAYRKENGDKLHGNGNNSGRYKKDDGYYYDSPKSDRPYDENGNRVAYS